MSNCRTLGLGSRKNRLQHPSQLSMSSEAMEIITDDKSTAVAKNDTLKSVNMSG